MVVALAPPEYSGAGLQAHRLARTLIEMGVAVDLISLPAAWDRVRRGSIEGVPVFRLPAPAPPVPRLLKLARCIALAAHLLTHPLRYRVVHLHGTLYLLRVLAMLKPLLRFGIVYKATMFRADDAAQISGVMAAKVRRSVDRWVCVSEAIARSTLGVGIDPARVARVPNGVDLSAFRKGTPSERRETRRKLGLEGADRLWLTAGGIVRRKRLELLVLAWSLLDPSYHLMIVGPADVDSRTGKSQRGDNEYLSELRTMVSDNELQSRVTFFGRCDDMPALLKAADGFILASRQEGLPNSVLEAMAVGIPVVCTAMGAETDLAEIGPNRLKVTRDAPDEIALAVRDSPEPADEGIPPKFDLKALAATYAAMYQRIGNGR